MSENGNSAGDGEDRREPPGAPQRPQTSAGGGGPVGSKRRLTLIALAGAVLVVIIGAVLWGRGGQPPGPDPIIYQEGHNPFLESTGAACIGMPLGDGAVVYCVDSSGALQGSFDAIRSAVARSLATLSTGQGFGLVIWSEGSPRVLPVTNNTVASRTAAGDLLDEAQPSGSTNATTGIRAGLELEPETLCIIATKGPQGIDVDQVCQQAQGAGVLVRCLAVRDEAPGLAKLAERTGGSYQLVYPEDLKDWLRESQ